MTKKSRFCPSPTGLMHLGNLRTALFNWLYARSVNGKFLIRIEDTDKQRSTSEYSDLLLRDLNRLGLHWDEGPEVSANEENYYQSCRNHIYRDYFQKLIDEKKAYPCFCSPDSLARTRKRQLASGEPPRYPGTCSNLSEEEITKKRHQGIPEVLRFQIEKSALIEFNDVVRGKQQFRGSDLGDLVIRKQDGTPTFMFGNAVDDALMQVSLVMRGEDHLTNTPRQILILKALQLPIPEYAHLSIILGSDGAPLSKRNGSVSLDELIKHGYHPLAICNYIARLGHVYESNELLSMQQLAKDFDSQRLVKSSSRYDITQLNFWQKKTIETLEVSKLEEWLKPTIEQYQHFNTHHLIAFLRNNISFPKDAEPWLAMLHEKLSYSNEAKNTIQEAGKNFFIAAENAISNYSDWQTLTHDMQQTGVKGKKLFLPLRAALTGQTTGPGLAELVQLIGIEQAQIRFRKAQEISET